MNPTQTNDTPRKSGQRGADTSQPTGGDWHVLISGVHTDAEQHEIATEVDGCHVTLAELPVESDNGMMEPDGKGGDGSREYAHYDVSKAESLANARVMAAGRKLLEATRDAADCLDAVAGDMPPAKSQATRSIVARLRATISTATEGADTP